MKTNVIEKSRKPASKTIALFSRLSGVGVTGLSNHPVLQEEEISIQEKDNVIVEGKNDEAGSFCHDKETCQKQFNCQPGKCQNAYATIDLWF